MSFLSVWQRITEETDIKNFNELAQVVETTQPYISRKKKQDKFPVDWAYNLALKYNLLTEWILTGKGPKRLDDLQGTQEYDFPIVKEIDQWLKELIVNEPYRREWFRGNFEDAFPMFKEWKKRRDEQESKNSDTSSKKIA